MDATTRAVSGRKAGRMRRLLNEDDITSRIDKKLHEVYSCPKTKYAEGYVAACKAVKRMLATLSPADSQPERKNGKWITDDLSGIISCSQCGNDAPMETTGGRQYKSKFCQTCGADMRGGQDDAQYFVDVEEALNMAVNVLTAQPEIIQCKDCKHSIDFYGDGECYCRRPNRELDWIGDWNFYCGCAERREE